MDQSPPATPPATKQDHPSSTQPDEDEVAAASLLLLKEAAGPEGDTALQEDKENHLVPDESTVQVNMDMEKEGGDKTVVVTSSLVEEFSANEAPDDKKENEVLEQEEEDDGEEEEDEDDDDDVDDVLEEEEADEYNYPAVVVTEEVRRCNRNNGRGWICPELAEPGFATCLRHIIRRRETYQRFQLKKQQGSTSGSEATVETKIEDAATSAVGDQEEAANPSSPETLARAKRSKAGDSSEPDDEAA